MVTAIILSGGIGVRFSNDGIPKQYRIVHGKPIVTYVLEQYQSNEAIDRIIIVANPEWRPFLDEWIANMRIDKFFGYADPGDVRQESIYSGLRVARTFMEDRDTVIINDAVRPLVTTKMISDCLNALERADGAMMCIPPSDTLYVSDDGGWTITGLLNRSKLYAGQTPESFAFGKYYAIHLDTSPEELATCTGCSDIAFRHGLRIALVPSDVRNFKITTMGDLNRFETYLREEQGEDG